VTALRLLIAVACALIIPAPPQLAAQPRTPQQVAESLLEADRAFSTAAARTDMIATLSTMFVDSVIMPLPQTGFAKGRSAVLAALRALPGVADARVTWTPIRAGISADAAHGFTFGYVTLHAPDSSRVSRKYMAYWVRDDAGPWRVIAYKQGRAPGPPPAATLMAAALPSAIISSRANPSRLRVLRHELMRAEDAFSQEAQRIGVGNAFAALGAADAVNMGGSASSSFVVGAQAIATHVARGDMAASDVVWGADTAFVASSGDLGITFGVIREKKPEAGSDPGAGYPFFTIWRRAGPTAPWRYVAE
jgi:ketosteroid isomerase-like protein